MNFERFILNGPLTLFKANVFGEVSDNAWQAISEDKQKGRDLRTLVSISNDDAFSALYRAKKLGVQLLINGEIVNPLNFDQYRTERARNVRTMEQAAEALPVIAKHFADLVPFVIDAPVAEQHIRELMPERQIAKGKTLKDLAADYLAQAIAAFEQETRDFKQVRSNNPNVIEAPTDREELRKMIWNGKGQLFAFSWSMGEGKSEFCNQLLDQCQKEGRIAALLAPRKSHHAQHIGGSMHYETIKKTKNAGSVAVGTTNSICQLPEFEKYRTESSFLGIDEFEQTRAHNAGEAVLDGRVESRGLITHNTNNTLLSAIHNGSALIMDAQMSEHAINDVAKLTGKKIILSRSNQPKRKRKLTLHRNHEQSLKCAQRLFSAGGRIVMFADMSHSAQKDDLSGLIPSMLSVRPGAKVLMIDREYVNKPENAEALKNINATIESHDLVIISPAINSGFSITTDQVDAVFVLASGTVLPTEFVQTLGRFRAMGEVHVSFEIVYRPRPTRPHDVLRTLAHVELLANGYSDAAVEHLFAQPGVEQVCTQIARDNKMREHYENRALIMARMEGFEMVRAEEEKLEKTNKETGRQNLHDGQLVSEDERAEQVMGCDRINKQQAKELGQKSSRTWGEEIQLENYKMRNAYRTPELDRDLIMMDKNGWMRGVIANWKLARMGRTRNLTIQQMLRRRVICKLFDCINTDMETVKPVGNKEQDDAVAFFTKDQAKKFADWIKTGEMKISGHSFKNRNALMDAFPDVSPRMSALGMVKKLLGLKMGLLIDDPEAGVYKFMTSPEFEHCYALATADVSPSVYQRSEEEFARDAAIEQGRKDIWSGMLAGGEDQQETQKQQEMPLESYIKTIAEGVGVECADFESEQARAEQEKAKQEKLERMASARPARAAAAIDWTEAGREYSRQLEKAEAEERARREIATKARRARKVKEKYKRKEKARTRLASKQEDLSSISA